MNAYWKDGKSYLNDKQIPESEIWAILRQLKAYQIRNAL